MQYDPFFLDNMAYQNHLQFFYENFKYSVVRVNKVEQDETRSQRNG